jgi:hypothetical protein
MRSRRWRYRAEKLAKLQDEASSLVTHEAGCLVHTGSLTS